MVNIDFANDLKWRYCVHVKPNSVEQKLLGFSKLKKGWRFGEGVRPSDDVIKQAVKLNKIANGMAFVKTDAVPLIDGAIELSIMRDDYDLEFVIENDLSINYCKMKSDAEIEEAQGLNLDQAVIKTINLWDETCELSDYSYSGNTAKKKRSSLPTPSATHATSRGYPLSISGAFVNLNGHYVSI